MARNKIIAYEYLIVELYRYKLGKEELSFREILDYLYNDKKMSIGDIAKEFKVGKGTVFGWLKANAVQTREVKRKC